MQTKKNIKLNNIQNLIIKNTTVNSVIYSLINENYLKSFKLNKGFRAGKAFNLLNKIEQLILKPSKLSLTTIKTNVNYITNQKLNQLELNKIYKQAVLQSSNFYENILKFSKLTTEKELTPSNTNYKFKNSQEQNYLITNLNLKEQQNYQIQYKFVPYPKGNKTNLFSSLNSIKYYYYYLSNILNTINLGVNKGRLNKTVKLNNTLNFNDKVKIYKIRHYLNLLSKFDYNLSTSFYNIYQFKKSNKLLFAMEKAAEYLRLSFLSKGCLISKPIFNFVYPQNSSFTEIGEIDLNSNLNLSKFNTKNNKFNKAKIIIHLFYFMKKSPDKLELFNNNNISQTNITGQNKILDLNNTSTDLKSLSLKIKGVQNFRDKDKAKNITYLYDKNFTHLTDYLSKLFNADIELELIRLYQPYHDSNIFVQYLNNKSYNFKFISLTNRLFKIINIYRKKKMSSLQIFKGDDNINTTLFKEEVSFPSGISGVNIKLAGRPIKERIVPRYTVKRTQRGNFNRFNTKMIEKSMFTDKSKKGAFNFSVRLSHIFR